MFSLFSTEFLLILFTIYLLPILFTIWVILRLVRAHEKLADGVHEIKKSIDQFHKHDSLR